MIESVSAASTNTTAPAARTDKAQQTVKTAQVKTAEQGATPKVDTVELSIPVQARLLYGQGLTVEQIAVRFDLDTVTVSQYLEG